MVDVMARVISQKGLVSPGIRLAMNLPWDN